MKMGAQEVMERLRFLDSQLISAKSSLVTTGNKKYEIEIIDLRSRMASLEQQLNPAPVHVLPESWTQRR